MSGTDWGALMRAGLGGLGLPPGVFWAMTPVELARALEGAGLVPAPGRRSPGRAALEAMMARYPDAGGGGTDAG